MNRCLAVLVAGLLSATAHAAQSVASVDAHGFIAFGALDSDNNGYVSRVEARSVSRVEQAFGAVDANRDGLLDRSEYQRVRPNGEVQRLAQ